MITEEVDIQAAVDRMTKSSIELAEAASNYGALKVIFGVFMVIVLLFIILFIYQTYSLTAKVNNINLAATKTQEFFDEASERTIGLPQGQVIIRRALNSLSTTIKYTILRIKLENHIDNKEAIKAKVKRLVKNEYIELNSFFSNFICNEHPLNEVLNEIDMEEIEKLILDQVYLPKSEFSVFLMDQTIDIYLNGIKLMYIKKLQ